MFAVIESATKRVMPEVPRAGVEDIDTAIALAEAAFPAWRSLVPTDRAARSHELADPLDETTQMGPLTTSDSARDGRVFSRRRCAGDDPRQLSRQPGLLVALTVLCPVDPGSRAAREEMFGPVAAVIPFRDEEDAVRLANDSIYGLSGSIWTRDGARALRVARAIDTGVLSSNSNTLVHVATPFGGFKQSGYGRELGAHAVDAYAEVKSIFYSSS